MLQGVVARGTARAIAQLSPYVAGKTGTSDDENDAWFVGFTNDVTVGVWVGYDKRTASGAPRRRRTGGRVAVPIFEPIIDDLGRICPAGAAPRPRPRPEKSWRRPRSTRRKQPAVSERRERAFTVFPAPNARWPTPVDIVSRPRRQPRSGLPGDMAPAAVPLLSGGSTRPPGPTTPIPMRPRPPNASSACSAVRPMFSRSGRSIRPPRSAVRRPHGELRSRPSEERRFVAPRRVDPDYPYRGQRY